ncbi:hypothetical protein Lser_V15G32318 [Lactuca serriola]
MDTTQFHLNNQTIQNWVPIDFAFKIASLLMGSCSQTTWES